MKKILIILFTIISLSVNAQKVNTIVIGIPEITAIEYKNIEKIIHDNKSFKFSYYCTKEKAFVITSDVILSQKDIELLFMSAIDIQKMYYKNVPEDMINFCNTNSDNKILKP